MNPSIISQWEWDGDSKGIEITFTKEFINDAMQIVQGDNELVFRYYEKKDHDSKKSLKPIDKLINMTENIDFNQISSTLRNENNKL